MKNRIVLPEFDSSILNDNSSIKFEYQLSDNTQYGRYYKDEIENTHITKLRHTLDSLPGIETFGGTDYNGVKPIHIWFKVKVGFRGLFFVTRCVDRRYWDYGHRWRLELEVGDAYDDECLPIYYLLHSGDSRGDQAYVECNSLIQNLNKHLNHKAFMKGYNLNVDEFATLKKLKISH